MHNWFRFSARGRFRISPAPAWQWPATPTVASSSPDRPTPGWPTSEYTAMQDAVNTSLLRGGPTLNYTDPLSGEPRSLVVKAVEVALPTRAGEDGTAVTAGTVVFETACFNPVTNEGVGGKLGEWLAWVEVTYDGGSAAVQLLTLDAVNARAVDQDGAGLSFCAMTGGRLFVRDTSGPAV